MRLRSYQAEAIAKTQEAFNQGQSALAVMATGLGKTVYFTHMMRKVPGRAMVIAHRQELITQAAEKVWKIIGQQADIEMAGQYANRICPNDVVISTVQTLARGRFEDFNPMDFGLFVIDEAHHATASTYRRVIDYFKANPDCKILGVTATPDRTDEEALGQIFENVAYEYGICEGIQDGWLVPIKQNQVFVDSLDLSGVSTRMGDLSNSELAAVLEFEQNLHGIACPVLDICGDRKTLIFCASVDQAERLSEILNRSKPGEANFVTGATPKDVRRAMFDDYAAGRFQYLCNVGVATEGFDEPGVEVVVMARPTKSRCLYTQMAGRGTRPTGEIAHTLNDCDSAEQRRNMIAESSKQSVEILDFVGNAGRHKLVNSADILGGKFSDEIVSLAKDMAQTKARAGQAADMMTELQRAEAEIARRRKRLRESANRSGIALKAAFSTKGVDPFDVLGIMPQRIPGWSRNKEATHNQTIFLKRRGIDASEINFVHASQLIDAIKQKEKGCMPFGKHAGKRICDVPDAYLGWCLDQAWLKPELRSAIEDHLYGRAVSA